ncbi:MAG: ELWxxDGT repeat protein [Planctomycetales bacterium]
MLLTVDLQSTGTVGPSNSPLNLDRYQLLTTESGRAFFVFQNAATGAEVWTSDGTAAGTHLVKDLSPGSGSSNPEFMGTKGEELYFFAHAGVNGQQLWKTDGTAAGTVELTNITGADFFDGLIYTDMHGWLGNDLYLTVHDPAHGSELWKVDVNVGGATLVSDLVPGAKSSTPYLMTVVNGTLYFGANDQQNDTLLYKIDNGTGLPVLLKDVAPADPSSPHTPDDLWDLTDVNGTLFFTANDGIHGMELWVSDGTSAGTKMVKDINPSGDSVIVSFPYPTFLPVGAGVAFEADDGVHGRELWFSDGTEAGTKMLKDINPNGSSFSAADHIFMRTVNGRLYISADDGVHGKEPWTTDGTEVGTQMILDINNGLASSDGSSFVGVDGSVLFIARDGEHGAELWKTAGMGASLVKDIYPGSQSSGISELSVVQSQAVFFANDAVHGKELWVSDGTSDGTQFLKDINPGGANVAATQLVVSNHNVYFLVQTAHGTELWGSDLTAEGTGMLALEHAHAASAVGTYRNGTFYLDLDGNNRWSAGGSLPDQSFAFGVSGDLPVSGNWSGNGATNVGVFRNGTWFLDQNGNYKWNGVAGGDVTFNFGTAGDVPITGDWNGDGITDVGVYRSGAFYLDLNGNHKWDAGVDAYFKFGNPGDKPVTGDWNGDGKTDVGVFRGATWYLDQDGSRKWSAADVSFNFGTAGDTPVTGDWNGDGKTDVGVYRSGFYYIDKDGNRKWSASDLKFGFGSAGDTPVTGTWNLGAPSLAPPAPSSAVVVSAPEAAVVVNTVAPEVTAKAKKGHVKKTHKGKS